MVDISNSEKHGVDHTLNLRIHACAPCLCTMTTTTYQFACVSCPFHPELQFFEPLTLEASHHLTRQ